MLTMSLSLGSVSGAPCDPLIVYRLPRTEAGGDTTDSPADVRDCPLTWRCTEPAVDPTLDSCRVCIVYNIQARVRFETKFNASRAIYRTNRLTVVNPLWCRPVRWCRLAGYGGLRTDSYTNTRRPRDNASE